MKFGTVKFFNETKGYGFIGPDDGSHDAFVHISAVERAGMQTLIKDQRIGYDLEDNGQGKLSAVNLTLVDQPSTPPMRELNPDIDVAHAPMPVNEA